MPFCSQANRQPGIIQLPRSTTSRQMIPMPSKKFASPEGRRGEQSQSESRLKVIFKGTQRAKKNRNKTTLDYVMADAHWSLLSRPSILMRWTKTSFNKDYNDQVTPIENKTSNNWQPIENGNWNVSTTTLAWIEHLTSVIFLAFSFTLYALILKGKDPPQHFISRPMLL